MSARQRNRFVLAAALLAVMTAALHRVSADEYVPGRRPFVQFPTQLAAWSGSKAADLDSRVLDVLGVDDYLNWTITRSSGQLLGLYVGYWGTQRHGDTIHSPLNCLPGSGWQPVSRRTLPIEVTGPDGPRTIFVNRIVIEKGLDRQLVLYWYQSRDRIVASEYAAKVYTVLDAIRYRRSDAAIVRIVSPVSDGSAGSEQDAERTAAAFVHDLFPVLPGFLPL
jgi:EpsI family protein